MDDQRVGAAFRVVRIRRGWRQEDVAVRVGVSRSTISNIERGHLDRLSLATLRAVAAVLDVRVDLVVRWRGADLAGLLNAGHAALHEELARAFRERPGWEVVPEVSFSIYGERGVIDVLAWHAATRTALVIELKTVIADVNELIGNVDRKRRLAPRVAAERGWDARAVACWVIVAEGRSNRRRLAAHAAVLRAAFPEDGHVVRSWLQQPDRPIAALSFWQPRGGAETTRRIRNAGRRRVRRAAARSAGDSGG